MKTVIVPTVLLTVLLITGCERLPLSGNNDNNGGVIKAKTRKDLGRFGFLVDEKNGQVRVYHNGRVIGNGTFNPETEGKQAIAITPVGEQSAVDVSLLGISYTPLGCSNFNNTGGNIRTFVTDWNLNSGSHEFIVPVNFTTTNLHGIGSSLKTNIASDGNTTTTDFTIQFEPALVNCATFSFFLDLQSGF